MEKDLIQEAKDRGYRKGTPIKYIPQIIDYVIGDHFEIDENGDVVAYAKPKDERKGFDDYTHDTLYSKDIDKWTEIVK